MLNIARKGHWWWCGFILHILIRELLPKGGFLCAPSLNLNFSCLCANFAAHGGLGQFADLVEDKSEILSNNSFPLRSIS